jgi:hypothetical protein
MESHENIANVVGGERQRIGGTSTSRQLVRLKVEAGELRTVNLNR